MRLFLDTANVDEIRTAVSWGVISGLTTNPSLVAREGRPFTTIAAEVVAMVPGPVSLEVMATDVAGMVAEARELASVADNVVIKIPMTTDGLTATHQLAGLGIATNMTLCFSANQCLLAARAGAAYVSPFVGRLDDVGQDGILVVAEAAEVFARHGLTCQIIAASIRHPRHVLAAARAGAAIATVPFAVLTQMVRHPLTDAGLAAFRRDWEKSH